MRDGFDNKCQNAMLDSNEFLSKYLSYYIAETFLASIIFKKTSKESYV
jgi:hypothetical protein